jgi:hypothetical protein
MELSLLARDGLVHPSGVGLSERIHSLYDAKGSLSAVALG